ncbi:MAG: nickel-dependent hydrogenase large subunit [Chloroflexi bacterium]|nr:nickel-dependent hydrogenase large subunit [Chloroflexota bacterium]
MSRTITIDPVTRIEGHSKITIQMDDNGQVEDARFHVTQFRGFEKLSEGRPFHEMPALTARVCGICPVSHLIASAKTCDALLAVTPAAHGQKPAPHHELEPDHPVSRLELFPSLLAGFGDGHGRRPGQTSPVWRGPIQTTVGNGWHRPA